MFLAYEFGDPTLHSIEGLSPQEVGRWLAFFKRKTELETPKSTKGKGLKGSGSK